MPKPEILDPQGQAVAGALGRLGIAGRGRRAAGQALRARGRRRGGRRDAAPHRRPAAGQPGDRGLDGDPHAMSRIGVITFPGSLDDVDAARAVRLAGGEPVALWHAEHDLRGVDAVVVPGRLLLRRLPARRRDRQPGPDHDRGGGRGRRRDAGARHLQRLPDPLRGRPAARRAGPQRGSALRLPRPAAARRDRGDRLDRRATRRAPRSSSRSSTPRAGSWPTPTRWAGSRARAGWCSATRVTTRTARCPGSPGSARPTAGWSG